MVGVGGGGVVWGGWGWWGWGWGGSDHRKTGQAGRRAGRQASKQMGDRAERCARHIPTPRRISCFFAAPIGQLDPLASSPDRHILHRSLSEDSEGDPRQGLLQARSVAAAAAACLCLCSHGRGRASAAAGSSAARDVVV